MIDHGVPDGTDERRHPPGGTSPGAQRARALRLSSRVLGGRWLACLLVACLFIPARHAPAANAYFDRSVAGGTIGSDKNSTALSECPNNKVLVGVRVMDRSNGAPSGSTGMLMDVDLLCGSVLVSPSGTLSIVPDAAVLDFAGFDQGDGTFHTATCPANQAVTAMGGDTFVSSGFAWASTLRIYCRPILFDASGRLRVDTTAAYVQSTAGDDENNNGSGFAGPFCGTSGNMVVRGYRGQRGGEGYDGINVSCATVGRDYGDAPSGYGTPSHEINAAVYLGLQADVEPTRSVGAAATGDDQFVNTVPNTSIDDEDGVIAFPRLAADTTSYTVTVIASNHVASAATLVGWIDFDKSNTFDADEASIAVVPPFTAGADFVLTWPDAASLATGGSGQTFARFRIATEGLDASASTDALVTGEVEDYALQLLPVITLHKTTEGVPGGSFGFELTNTLQTAGSVTTTLADTPTQVDGDTVQPGVQPYAVASASSPVTIRESALPPGWQLAGATCVDAGNAQVGSRAGATYTLTAAQLVTSSRFDCTFTNSQIATDLSITKTNTPGLNAEVDQGDDTVMQGAVTTYTMRISNDGPVAAGGAIARDVPAAGLSACVVSSCAGEQGASCPADPATLLTAAGAVIPVLPAGGAIAITVTCMVD